MNEQQQLTVQMVDEVNLKVDRIRAVALGIVAGTEAGMLSDEISTLADMIDDMAGEINDTVNGWYESGRAYREPAKATQNSSGTRPQHRTDRFDCQSERPGA